LKPGCAILLPVPDYDLGSTLECGQAFRWRLSANGWEGMIDHRWVRLRQLPTGLAAETAVPVTDWNWLTHYLQTEINYAAMLAQYPDDAPLQTAFQRHRGLRLLRQPAWECLASFILSSTKQIVQIRQIIELLCRRFGEPVTAPSAQTWWMFPSAARLAQTTESELRACKMGFRARYLHAAARAVAQGELDLPALGHQSCAAARARLLELPGVGEKIADCVLLFAFGFPEAFPIDVWVARALRQFYFRGRNVSLPHLRAFAAARWRSGGGYAQQYLFHHIRHSAGKTADSLPAGH
jgi:N-glycosylase/DNA lyase